MRYIFFFLLASLLCNAQTDTSKAGSKHNSYPELKGYVGLVHPLYTISSEGNQPNFRDYYVVGNPWGINIWKGPKFGITFEFTPFIRVDRKSHRVANVLFHPGVMYRLGKEFTLIGRLAYETSGRYGFTSIISKVVKRSKSHTVFVALLLPTRFGNGHAGNVTAAFQFGVGF